MRRDTPLLLAGALAGALAFVPALSAQTPSKGEARPAARAAIDSLALARRFTQWFYDARWDSLLAHSPADGHPGRDELQRQLDQLTVRAGTETRVLEEKFVMRNGRPQYWRTAQFSGLDEPILLRWVIDPQGQIAGMGLGPLSQAPPIDPPPAPAAPTK